MPNKIKVVGFFASFLMVVVMSCACGTSSAQDAGKSATNAAAGDYRNVTWGMTRMTTYKAIGRDPESFSEYSRLYHGFQMKEFYKFEKDLLVEINTFVDLAAWSVLTNDMFAKYGKPESVNADGDRIELVFKNNRTRAVVANTGIASCATMTSLVDVTGESKKL